MNATPRHYCQAVLQYSQAGGLCPTEVKILDGRGTADLSWQAQGFECLQHPTDVRDWNDVSELVGHHYGEMAALAKTLTGCRHALVTGHIARNPEQARKHADYAPIQFVHSDFTDNYAEQLIARYELEQPFEMQALARAGITLTELRDAEHLLILQFWRNLGAPQPDLPLTLCDAQSVPRSDLQAFHVPGYAGGDFAFDTFAVRAPVQSGSHRWYTFPNLDENEVIAFRTFDSRRAGSAQPFWTPHSAFRDPNAADPAPARRSIEIRVTCLF